MPIENISEGRTLNPIDRHIWFIALFIKDFKMSHFNSQEHKGSQGGHQHGAEFEHEKMERRYDDGVEHKHNRDHHQMRDHEESHPHTQHGGDPKGHKHPKQTHHERHEHDEHRHHKTKEHDHKEHSREHHKTGHHE